MELASLFYCSKGYMGECGLRGGYAEILNLDPAVKALYLKSISAKLCPTVLGQVNEQQLSFQRCIILNLLAGCHGLRG